MAWLDELISSLGTVLVCYNEKQKKYALTEEPNRTKAREQANAILQAEDYEKKFNELNLESIARYKDRENFLAFLKDEIVFLKKLSQRKHPFSAEELEKYKSKITILFIDLKKLLVTKKSETCAVQINKLDEPLISVSLYGCAESGWTRASYCYSGKLIKEEVLERFNIKESTSEIEIKEMMEHLCQTHQNALLVDTLNQQQQEFATFKLEYQRITEQLVLFGQIKSELLQAQNQIKEQQEQIEELTLELKKTQSALDAEKAKTTLENSGGMPPLPNVLHPFPTNRGLNFPLFLGGRQNYGFFPLTQPGRRDTAATDNNTPVKPNTEL